MRSTAARSSFAALVPIVALSAALFVVAMFSAREAQADQAGPAAATIRVDLYTIGPGSYLFARYGHSLLCVHEGEGDAPTGRCYDYGVPDRDEAVHMTWGSIRGDAIFVAMAVAESVVLDVFRAQGRSIERQRLPLAPDDVARLVNRLESDVRHRVGYAYHPYFANCTTQVRDRIDEASEGRLRPGKREAPTMRFREMAEAGLSGRLVELTALAFLLGGASERKPTAWEAMFVPEVLRDGVTERFFAAPQRVEERKAVILPTSRAVGRLALVVLAFALTIFVRWALRKRQRLALGVTSVVLGGMALVAELVALAVVWPEFRHNAALLLLLPTDLLLLLFLRRGRAGEVWLGRYALARVVMAAVIALLEVAGVIAQPILPVTLLVLLPMGAIAVAMRERSRASAARPVKVAG